MTNSNHATDARFGMPVSRQTRLRTDCTELGRTVAPRSAALVGDSSALIQGTVAGATGSFPGTSVWSPPT